MLSCEFCWIFKNIYFTNVCEDLPLKNKMFVRVSFRKILYFYYKWNRQLFYYEGTSLYVLLKILERVNRIIFQTSFEFLLLNITQQTKIYSKLTTKQCFRVVIRLSLDLAWKIFLKSMTESRLCKSSALYVSSRVGVFNGVCF